MRGTRTGKSVVDVDLRGVVVGVRPLLAVERRGRIHALLPELDRAAQALFEVGAALGQFGDIQIAQARPEGQRRPDQRAHADQNGQQ